MASFQAEWFHDVPELMAKVDAMFAAWVATGKAVSRSETTKKRIYDARGWRRRYAERDFASVLDRFQVFYLPKALRPGPAFVFPLRDLDGRYGQAQVRPLPESCLFMPDHKYRRLGTERPFKGPQWFGNDAATVRTIIERRKVCLVEGPFDVLACKLLAPDAPVLTTLTKGVGEDHVEYLRILGVNTVVTMFDYEESGQGARGAKATKWRVEAKYGSGIEVVNQASAATDPSDALAKSSESNIIELELFLKGL